MSKSRSYCFTINNYTQEDINAVKALKSVQYLVYGFEVGEQGTQHIQGYVYFNNQVQFTSIKKKLPRAHIEKSKGNAQQNREYCIKQGNYVEEGEIPQRQGARNDIAEVREWVNQGKGMEEIVEVATSYQSLKCAEMLLKYKEVKRNFKPLVKWYYGATGTGKTKKAFEDAEGKRTYVAMDTARWFDGYDAHEVLIIDDMRKDFIKFHNLLKLLDRYEFRVETKGGTRQMLAKMIIVTSPKHPQDMYDTQEDINQLLRRIDEITCFE